VKWRSFQWHNLQLRYRLMLVFSGFCLLITLLFSLYAVAFAYTVEDEFFESMLKQEVTRQQQSFTNTGRWDDTRDRTLNVASSPQHFPDDIREQFAAHPGRREFAGDLGRHYHLAPLTTQPEGPWLIAQVADKLVFRHMRTKVLEILLVSTLIILALALLLAWWLASNTARPLSELADAIAGLEVSQLPDNLPSSLPGSGRADEVGALARCLEQLVARTHAFVEREKAFTRDASHELRTPLTVVRCAAEQIIAMPNLPATVQSQLQLIQSSTAKLEQIVVTLLKVAREQTEPVTPVRVLPMLEQIIVEQSPWLDQKMMQVRLSVDPKRTIAMPESILHILLSNLIGNAFQHGRTASMVDIYLQDDQLWIANLHVMPGDEPSENQDLNLVGYGFGLAIVRRLSIQYNRIVKIDHQSERTLVSIVLD
jgi:signal transduction histidine kinase